MLHALKAFLVLDAAILAFSFVIAGVSWLLSLINVDLNLTHILLAIIAAILSYTSLKLRLAAEAAKAAAVEVKQVKKTLETKNEEDKKQHAETKGQLDGIAAVGLRTELYCNSALGRALRVAKLATAATAAKTGNPLDIAAANQAARELADHEAKQAILDEKDAANSLPRPERQY